MAKLKIGKLPVYKGEYQNDINYSRLNLVSYLGTTFQSLTDDNIGHPPAELSADGGEITFINTNYWNIIAKGAEYNDNRIATDSNKGYKILKKNKSFAEQVTEENTIYVIRYDFTLDENVTIPNNCVLKFDGGSISGAYTLTGNNTGIHSNSNSIFGDNITISGTWNIPVVYADWIKNVRNTNNLRKAVALLSSGNKLVVGTGTHNLSLIDGDSTGINLPDNTELQIEGEIKANTNNLFAYTIIFPGENCYIHGGKITGDKDTSEATTGEHGHGITIWSNGVKIKNVEISNCWGDGIDSLRYFTVVENCKIHDCRRQGISVTYGTGIKIINNDIYNIRGTDPQCCIDVEPNDNEHPIYDIIIQGNRFHDSQHGVGMLGNADNTIKNKIIISNNFFDKVGITSNGVKNLIITENIITSSGPFINIVNSQDVIVSNNTCKNESDNYTTYGLGVDYDCKNIIIDNNIFNYTVMSSIDVQNCLFTNNTLLNCNIAVKNGANIKNNKINGTISVNVNDTDLYGAPAYVTNNHFYLKGSGSLFAFMTTYNNKGSFYFCNNIVKLEYDALRAFYFCDDTYFPNQMFAVFVEKDNIYDCPPYNVYYGIKFAKGIRTKNYDINENKYHIYNNGAVDDISILNGFNSFRFDAPNQRSKTYNADGLTSERNRGTTAQRPTSSLTTDDEGFRYFDTTLHKPIWYKGDGTWVDATGTQV